MERLSLGQLLLPFLSLARPALGGNPFCDSQPFWRPDGSVTQGSADWSSHATTSSFRQGPCLQLSGIGMTQTFVKTVLVIDRSMNRNGYITLPGDASKLAFALELDLTAGKQRGLDVVTNTFCSSGQHMPGGAFLSIGGDWANDYTGEGEFSLRSFAPCRDSSCSFKVVASLARSRWYPTSILLGDGRLMVVGGSSKGVGLNSKDSNNPWIEYYPKKPNENTWATSAYWVDLLDKALPYNLYPFVHLLPSGKVFIFAGYRWTLWDTGKNAPVQGSFPKIAAWDRQGSRLQFSYPAAGTSAMMPLRSKDGYTTEVMVCGGTAENAIHFDSSGKSAADAHYPATSHCFRILPESDNPQWVEEQMRLPRVMPLSVLLPDGNLLILGGTGTGYSGIGDFAHKPSLTPEMFNAYAKTWYNGTLATSNIPRSYHASAILLHDSSVLVTGSNPHDSITQGPKDFPTEFRTEFFDPPYRMPRKAVPKLVSLPTGGVSRGSSFPLSFTYPIRIKKFGRDVSIVLSQPGFSTHGFNHGMRQVSLDFMRLSCTGNTCTISAHIPSNANLLPSTWYWVFVVVKGVPNREGKYLFIR